MEDKVFLAALDRFKNAEEFERDDRRMMEEDLAFAAGEQWPEDVKAARKSTDRPCLTFNRLPAFIEQVVGDARQNRPAIKVHPVDEGADEDLAEVYEGLVRNIESQSRATSAYITAFTHAVTGSRGGWRVVTEYTTDDSFEQDIRIKRITNPFAISWDPGAKEYDKSDANWCFVSEWVTKESFEQKYPDKTPTDWPAEYRQFKTFNTWLTDDRVRLAEYWVKEPIVKTISLLSDGSVTDHEYAPDQKIIRDGTVLVVVSQRKVKSHKVVRYLMSGHTILEGPQEFPSRYIPIVPCFGPEEFINDQVRYRSLIRYAKDPQRMYNYWQTSIAEKIAHAPKAPFMLTPDMVEGHEQMWGKANVENRPYLVYNIDEANPGARPQRQEPAYVNAAEIQQSAQAVDDLKATMGIHDASLGAQGNETSGKAILARQREGDTATFAWVDNLSRSIEHTGRILIDMIPRVYDTQRIVRVLGEDDSISMTPINWVDNGQMVNDITTGKYDVMITVGPSYATKRIEAAESLMQFVQALPQAGEVAGDLIARSMDWPGADDIAERLRKLLPPGIAENDDEDGPEAEIERLQGELMQMGEAMEQITQQAELMAQELEKHNDAETEYKRSQAYKTEQDGRSSELKNIAVETGQAPLEVL